MARGERSERRLRRWQRDAAAVAFALFPMLAMAGRYGLPFTQLLGLNRRYSIKMTLVCIAVLWVYWAVAGGA